MAKVESIMAEIPLNQDKHIQECINTAIQTNLVTSLQTSPPIDLSNHLIASPYTEFPHLLDLSTLDTPNKLLSLALQKLEPTTQAYATQPYLTSFNWPTISNELLRLCTQENYHWPTTSFYCVVFTSTLRESCHYPDLSLLDKNSHAEAMASGGFLKYWFGSPDPENRKNLATCIWRSKEDARKGTKGEMHRRAVMAARESYEGFAIQVLRLRIGEGVGSWEFETWVD